jgi:hypothetical protein
MKGVDVWIYGHTHFSTTLEVETVGKTIVTSNQLGYLSEETGYSPDRTVNL